MDDAVKELNICTSTTNGVVEKNHLKAYEVLKTINAWLYDGENKKIPEQFHFYDYEQPTLRVDALELEG